MREFKSRVEENGEDLDGDPWEMRVRRGNVGRLVTVLGIPETCHLADAAPQLCTRENAEDFSEDEAMKLEA
jgi:hypothetical protein